LIYWGEFREVAYGIVQKLSQKIVSFKLLVSIYEYMRESEQVYKSIITIDHLQIIKSLAAVEGRNDLYGVIPENFFEEEIGVYPEKTKTLSSSHLRIVK
jgi:DNA-binding cell septation regulator SpoVG